MVLPVNSDNFINIKSNKAIKIHPLNIPNRNPNTRSVDPNSVMYIPFLTKDAIAEKRKKNNKNNPMEAIEEAIILFPMMDAMYSLADGKYKLAMKKAKIQESKDNIEKAKPLMVAMMDDIATSRMTIKSKIFSIEDPSIMILLCNLRYFTDIQCWTSHHKDTIQYWINTIDVTLLQFNILLNQYF